MPSDKVLIRLARLASDAQEALAADHPRDRSPVGLTAARNERRRAMESLLVQLADPDVRDYLARMKRLGLL